MHPVTESLSLKTAQYLQYFVVAAKEERAVRGAVKEAVATYKNETAALVETNWEDRKRVAKLLTKSAEDAEEILFRECTYDQAKRLKYRGKCAMVSH